MNIFVKGKKPTSPCRIEKLILMLNALRGCEDHLRAALGRERVAPEESTAVKATDVGAIVDALRETMGDDIFGDNRRHKNQQPFRPRPGPPEVGEKPEWNGQSCH